MESAFEEEESKVKRQNEKEKWRRIWVREVGEMQDEEEVKGVLEEKRKNK